MRISEGMIVNWHPATWDEPIPMLVTMTRGDNRISLYGSSFTSEVLTHVLMFLDEVYPYFYETVER